MNRKPCCWPQEQPRLNSHPAVFQESSPHIYLQDKHSFAPSWMNLWMWEWIFICAKVTFSSGYCLWTVYTHRPHHLGVIGLDKLLPPASYITICHLLFIVSTRESFKWVFSQHFFGYRNSGTTIWGFGTPGGERLSFNVSKGGNAYLFIVCSCPEYSAWLGSPSYGNDYLGTAR